MKLLCVGLFFVVLTANAADFGLDCSWPIHSTDWKCGDLLGDRQVVYDHYMQGCREKWGTQGAKRCDANEADRLEMTRRQPQSMVNYTSTGFKKIKAPPKVWDMLSSYWERNKDDRQLENWGKGNIYTNNWESETYMVSVDNAGLRGGGQKFKNDIWNAVRPTIEEWTGMKLQPTSLYGIRVYTEGAILAPHVDRLPLVSSCIINVAQDVEEPWLLEVYDRHDRAVNVTMEPGDMVLYESGSLTHGRPYPLKGNFYANIFIHFEPTGERLNGGWVEYDDFHPPYIQPNSPEMENWERRNPAGWKKQSPSVAAPGVHEGHAAAAHGDLESLREIAAENKRALHLKDKNGWQPIHEAVRAGHLDTVKYLVEQKADVNSVTNFGKGGVSPYYISLQNHGYEHPVTEFLSSLGAIMVGPEL
ncbi:ankyrin repeat domain protein [Nitzschia inconspicua]|uniref:Ankyrin repeat domain protein n=1 Tax=Nitzschia inconspicua TaxID=303405 RepID=A0A9K3LU24_9STRA|nr:ankyrin repeat domain protein [Nitzschia inconspicua]